ncbi:MAG: hypothetical protein SFV54_06500 [Bryobacteraceae bacterium]|nr:hypothetical protein [Bryobacteraceae bacterium]
MRTTIDIPDSLFREMKAAAALRGGSMKGLIVAAIRRELTAKGGKQPPPQRRVNLPLVRLTKGRKLDLTGIDLDNIPA